MDLLDAATVVLGDAGEPLHYQEIVRRVLQRGLWKTTGKTPDRTINADLQRDIRKQGDTSRFRHAEGRGMFALRILSIPGPNSKRPPPLQMIGDTKDGTIKQDVLVKKTLSFTDAAERILEEFGKQQPMHYRHITEKALDLGWVTTKGKSPEDTMNARIGDEISGKGPYGKSSRFMRNGKGFVGLSKWAAVESIPDHRPKRPLPLGKNGNGSTGTSIRAQIEQHNAATRKSLLARLQAMKPDDFERCIARLLRCQGYKEVEVTKRSGDKGIDVRATFAPDMFPTRIAIQVKRWQGRIDAPIVRHLRGSLRPHERGRIITTSGFSRGAKEEAKQSDKIPIDLMDGEQLVALLVTHNIGIRRSTYELIELDDAEGDVGSGSLM